jgi:hypothetical protein
MLLCVVRRLLYATVQYSDVYHGLCCFTEMIFQSSSFVCRCCRKCLNYLSSSMSLRSFEFDFSLPWASEQLNVLQEGVVNPLPNHDSGEPGFI